MLSIDAGSLLLHGAKRAAHGNSGQFYSIIPGLTGNLFGDIYIGGQFNAETIVESDFAVIDQFRLRESLVPFLGEIQGIHILVLVAAEQQQSCKGYNYVIFH